ncbi:MAG: GntR family transcriptional regulator [Betaproteobacteria bacterium]|nr:GntR family transcriptional regulator [Betaproteobacteria bacterium]
MNIAFTLDFIEDPLLYKSSYQLKAPQPSASDRIYESIRARIDSGAIRGGEKLPSTRSLAADATPCYRPCAH